MAMRILVVEDDQKIANAIQKGLEQESYAVDVEYNGADGEDAAVAFDYDLIILDRMLPGISDGLEILAKVRELGKNVPVLVLTARDAVSERIKGLNVGADDYLVKPFDFEELLARVKALLRRPQNHTGRKLVVDDLALDTLSHVAKRGNREIELSPKEYALLEYLMTNKGMVVTKENIIEHVWDFDADILPNTVEVYVGYLRNKIDEKGADTLIKTVRGFGYRMG